MSSARFLPEVEDKQKILSGSLLPQLENLIEASNLVCGENSRKSPALVLLKQKAATGDAVTCLWRIDNLAGKTASSSLIIYQAHGRAHLQSTWFLARWSGNS